MSVEKQAARGPSEMGNRRYLSKGVGKHQPNLKQWQGLDSAAAEPGIRETYPRGCSMWLGSAKQIRRAYSPAYDTRHEVVSG